MTSDARRALVVDDDDGTVALFRKILVADRWEVDTAHSGREASAKIQPGYYRLIVSDLYMPDGNGVELYESAVRADPELRRRFVFISGYTDSSAVKAFLLETGCPGIRKPIRVDEFRAVIEHVAEQKPLSAAALPSRWFTPDSQYLYSGEITGRHTIFSLLNRIYASRLIGELELTMGRVEKKLFFNLGNVVFASSNLPADGLGETMLSAGALTQAQFDEATTRMQQGVRFGFALVDLGVCTLAQLAEWVRSHVTQIATSVFEFRTGRYLFFDSFVEQIVPEVGIALPTGRLMLPALREAPGLPLDDLAHDEHLIVDFSPDPRMRFQDVTLNEDERVVLSAIARPMRAGDVFQASGLPAQQAARALYGLLALGMVLAVPEEEQKTQQAAAAAKAQPRPSGAPLPEPPLESTHVATAAAAAVPVEVKDLAEFEAEMNRLLGLCETGTHYQILGINSNSSPQQIRNNFYQLARKFHPDRHMGRSEWIDPLQKLMHAATIAYRTLSDPNARASYDERLAKAGTFTLGVSKTEKQHTAEECLELAKERLRAKNFAGAILWLRKCVEIAPNDSKYRTMLARSLAAVPQYRKEAIEHFEAAIRLDPWNTSAYYQLGELYEEMQLPWRARPLYQKILGMDPEHSKARERLRQLDAKEGKTGEKSPTFLGRLFARDKLS